MADVEFPAKLQFLFRPARYKVARGGRASAKSWSYARALLTIGANRPLRILCTREVQKSIKDSVHKLLSDQVQALGLGGFYEVLTTEIRGRNGTSFLFSGLSDQTVESIKSFEGVDIVWVEEGQAITKRSWQILIPTIRKEGSEIWVTFNPDLDDDETYKRFVVDKPDDCVSVEVNWRDNPWFTSVSEATRLEDQRKLPPDEYQNIWEGKTRAAVAGAIYASEVRDAIEQGRVCNVPYDPLLKVHVVTDLGWNDAMSLILVQRVRSEIRVIEAFEDTHRTLDWYSAELRERRYNWGTLYLPHDGKHKTLAAGGKSSEDIMRALGWNVDIVPDVGREDGIKQARAMFRQAYFDKTKTATLMGHLRRYRRAVSNTTNEPGAPVHDDHSHAADAWRYLAVVAPKLTNDDHMQPLNYTPSGIV